MKIRHPIVVRCLGFFVAIIARIWIGTLRFRYRALGLDANPHTPGIRKHWLYCIWHEALLVPTVHYGPCSMSVIISQHSDGDLITAAARQLGFNVVRGSTTRNGPGALRQLVRAARTGHLVVTPDGPRGPRRQVQAGLVYLAARTGVPIVPVGFGFTSAWRARSWDRFVLPRPFSGVWAVAAEPIVVPADASREDMEIYRCRVQQALDEVTAAAERLAGDLPGPMAIDSGDATRAA